MEEKPLRRIVINQASSACQSCSKLKMRCEVLPGVHICQRCLETGKECVWKPSQRGKWARKSKSNSSPSMDATDEEGGILPHLETPAEEPRDYGGSMHFKIDNALFPLGLLAEQSMLMQPTETAPPTSSTDSVSSVVGLANPAYFGQGLNSQFRPRNGKLPVPFIIAHEIITRDEGRELFKIFFEHCNQHIGVLDERLCSADSTASRSPFLYTTVCAVASRYYRGGALYNVLARQAHCSGMTAMFEAKTTYTVQGFLLLAYWSPPSTVFEMDNSWLYAGLAIRLGHEIGIHHANRLTFPPNMPGRLRQHYSAENLNRERTWMCCFIIDHLSGALTGKPETLYEKMLIRSASTWSSNPGSTINDDAVAGEVSLCRLIFRLLDVIYSSCDTKSAISQTMDYVPVMEDLNNRIGDWYSFWSQRLDARPETGVAATLKHALKLQGAFYRLIPLSLALQNCVLRSGKDGLDVIMFCHPCYQAATDVLAIAVNDLGPQWIRYAPDQWIIALAFCACFLLKLILSRHGQIFDRTKVLNKVVALVKCMREASVGNDHAPSLYAAFIERHVNFCRANEPVVFTANPQPAQDPPFDPFAFFDPQLPYFAPIADHFGSNSNPVPEPDLQVESILQTDWLDSFFSQQQSSSRNLELGNMWNTDLQALQEPGADSLNFDQFLNP